ncbi:MAG: response regulator transcription factor [Sandaracinaceae bacterium]
MAHAAAATILLIEDDPSLALGLCDTLEFEGFQVEHARTGQDGIATARREHPDCIILALMLPDTNGYRVCEQIRRHDPVVPIIMLTARSQEADKIRGLDSGADDYVTKPFSVGELVARIRAIFRRLERGPQKDAPLTIGQSSVDPASQVLTRGRDKHQLSFYEVELLKLLYERAGQPVGREEILDRVWGIEATPHNRTVDNTVVKLRRKLEPKPDQPRHILTVYGVGYKLVV